MPLICVSSESYERIEQYAGVAGITTERAASEAIEKWMDTTGDAVMLVMERRKKSARATARCEVRGNLALVTNE